MVVIVDGVAPPSPGRWWVGPVAELAASFGTAALFTLASLNIKVDPIERVGQVSGLASLGFRFVLVALVLVIALAVAARVRGGAAFAWTARLVYAAIAGLASGMVAGGLVVALRGTPWGLNGLYGDAGTLISWASNKTELPMTYPPLGVKVLGWYANIADIPVAHAMKHLQIIGVAAMGPIAYASWRLVLRPGWALGIGVVAALPLIDSAPYRPYANIVLILLVPLAVRFLATLRRVHSLPPTRLGPLAVAFGAAFGTACLLYSGWFQWTAPGFLVAMLVLLPWRQAAKPALLFAAIAFAVFFALTANHLIPSILTSMQDKYFYFDVTVEPAYVAMFRGDLPGAVGTWPPLGELGGVGLFTVLLAVGLGVAVALGRSRSDVFVVAAIMVGCWLMRFWVAHLMYKTKLVQLWPRTTVEILYCLLILCGLAVLLVTERLARRPESVLRRPSAAIGAVCGLLLILGSAGSAISDRYMPANSFNPLAPGWLAWIAHKSKQ